MNQESVSILRRSGAGTAGGNCISLYLLDIFLPDFYTGFQFRPFSAEFIAPLIAVIRLLDEKGVRREASGFDACDAKARKERRLCRRGERSPQNAIAA
jgi:hypothetical protein